MIDQELELRLAKIESGIQTLLERISGAPQILTIEDAAKYARVSVRTMYAWIAEKGLSASKQGKKWQIYKDDLDKFIKTA